MEYITDITNLYIKEKTAISLGKFDGFHRGHNMLMEQLMKKKSEGLKAVIFTFDIPPRQSISQVEAKVLTTNQEKRHLFEQAGADYLIECPFTTEIMCMEPEDFIRMLIKRLCIGCVVVGEDFYFGHNRRGNYHLLKEFGRQYQFETVVLKKIKEDARDISSTFVREEIVKGNIGLANRLLGYHYFLTSYVRHGNRIGRTIGIPTINQIPPKEKLLPPNGVYVTEIYIDDKKYRGITNVGCKPTVGAKNPVGVETHLLDFSEDLYDREVTVEFLKRVRPEQKFDSIDALKQQMLSDINYGRAYFS